MNISLMCCALGLFAINVAPAHASSWNLTAAGSTDSALYFDADTVEKAKGVVTIWVKTVQYYEADSDGSWSRASRWRINCANKTIQTLASSTYTADGKFISSPTPSLAIAVVTPDSVGEGMLKIACDGNFPNDKSKTKYFKLDSNDVFQATKAIVEAEKKATDTAPH